MADSLAAPDLGNRGEARWRGAHGTAAPSSTHEMSRDLVLAFQRSSSILACSHRQWITFSTRSRGT
jgi:hypothetical protein